jgi:hypothetical protein
MNMTIDTLPFGGVGESGMGAYHGKHGFDLMTHKRSVMARNSLMEIFNEIRYPPFSSSSLWRIATEFLLVRRPAGFIGKLLKRVHAKTLLYVLGLLAAYSFGRRRTVTHAA